jgi:hypothetical protein
VILANENWMKKSQNMLVGSAKWFWCSIFAQFAEVRKRHNKT